MDQERLRRVVSSVARYRFLTIWQIRAPIDRVFDAIYDSRRWPEWWRGVERVVELRPPDADGLGGLTRYVWKSALPYQLTIDTTSTRIDRPFAMDGRSTGELIGEGRWRLQEDGGVTTVRYEWAVATTKAWMNLLAPLARPLFAWNHDVVMRQGGDGLRALLESRPQGHPGFHPDRLAWLEAAGWRANYDRRWPRLLWLVLRLAREEFDLPWPRAIEAAYHITKASIAWVPIDHDLDAVRRGIRRFYTVASRYGGGLRFDPEQVAALELEYWMVHRELSGQPEAAKGPLEDVFARLHSALFGLPIEATRSSAVSRARATDTVDLITSRRSADVELDWVRVERYLREAYGSLAEELARR